MARTKARVQQDHRDARQAPTIRRRRLNIAKMARILSSQEVAELSTKHTCTCAQSDAEMEDSEPEPEEDTFSSPDPEQVIKLSAQECGYGGRYQWRGRLRGGGKDVFLESDYVRKNFNG